MHLSALVIVTNADRALAAEAIGPETTKLDVSLGHVHVGQKEPQAEDWLGEDIENSVSDDLTVDGDVAGAVGDTPDTVTIVSMFQLGRGHESRRTLGKRSRG